MAHLSSSELRSSNDSSEQAETKTSKGNQAKATECSTEYSTAGKLNGRLCTNAENDHVFCSPYQLDCINVEAWRREVFGQQEDGRVQR